MKIDIDIDDLWWLRDALNKSIDYMGNFPYPNAFSKTQEVARKINKEVSRAIEEAFGQTRDGTNNQKDYE